MQGLASHQSIGELQFAGFGVVSNYWGVPTCSVLVCPNLLGRQLVGNSNLQGLAVHEAMGELQLARSCFALISWGITTCRGDSVISVKHSKPLVDCGSSYILNTPFHVPIPVHDIS